MRRRAFTAGLAATLPALTARAQTSAMPTVGLLFSSSARYFVPFAAAVREGLADQGFVEGRNVAIEYRTAESHYDRLAGLAKELVERKVSIILAAGGTDPAKAAKAATTTIPIVFFSAADPVRAGVVASLNRPGGNITGVSQIGSALEAKRLEYLHRLAPGTRPIAALVNPKYPDVDSQIAELQKGAELIKRPVHILRASSDAEVDAAFVELVRLGAAALTVGQDPYFGDQRGRLAALANQLKLPAIYWQREFVVAGGLMSYGADFVEGYRQAGIYLGRILKGAKPADLPVLQPSKFQLIVSLRTARTIGIEVPPDILAAADEVIE
jgi:putative tryptophan/tyrosine transport system substrate-binding protein